MWPAAILLQQILEHLYIDHTFLHDVGYWISLSTKFNPLLIEPASLNAGYSYFNTHFSPVFLILQIIFNIIQGHNPPLFFACWFWFLGISSIVIALAATLYQSMNRTGQRLYQQIAILLAVAAATYSYTSSNTWQNSFIDYLHPEIIGMQLIGSGWLILAFNEINLGNRLQPERLPASAQTRLGITLILLGSFFHELIGVIAILLLISIKFYRKGSLHLKDFWSSKEPTIYISLSLAGWTSLKLCDFFPGSSQIDSALTRIYLGSPILSHITPERYLGNLQELIARNQFSIMFLFASLAISFTVAKRALRLLLLPSIILLAYGLLSPLAVYNKAATLAGHYNYPLSLSFFLLLLSLSLLAGSRQSRQSVISATRVFPAVLLVLFILIPFGQLTFSQQRIKVFDQDSLNSLETSAQIKRTTLKKAPSYFSLFNSISNLWTISINSNEVIRTLASNRQNLFSSVPTSTIKDKGYKSQQTIILVDHSFAALYPNLIGYCNLIALTRQPCLDTIIDANTQANLTFLSMQPRDSLDIKMIQEYLTLLSLKHRRRLNVGRYLNQNYQITLFSR